MKRKLSSSILITLLTVMGCSAQGASFANSIENVEKRFIIKQLNDKYWKNSTSSNYTDIADIYQDAPAVVLQQTVSREYYRNSRNYLRTIKLEHKVIRIQDREGVRKNSVFTYEHIDSDFAFDVTAIRVIKPDGRQRIIDLDSISVTRSYDKVEYRQFVIPGLEPGDILDYYYYIEFRVLFPQQYSRVFDPVYWLPQGADPILSYDLEFILGPSAFLNASTHKLPAFESANYKIDRKTFSKYSLTLENLDPIDLDMPHLYPFRELPNLRFQVFISPYSGHSDIIYNLGGSLKLNTEIQHSRLQDYMEFSLSQGRDYKKHYTGFTRYLKSTGQRRKKMDETELAAAYYYYVRGRRELARLQDKPVQTDAYQFISRASYSFRKLGIDHDILLGFDRSLTAIDQFILTDEITPLIRIKDEAVVLLDNPLFNTVPGEVNAKLENTRAYTYDPVSLRLNRAEIPGAVLSHNSVHVEIDVVMNDTGNAEIKNTYTVSGHEKLSWQRQFMNKPQLFLQGDEPGYSDLLAFLFSKKKSSSGINKKIEEKAVERDRTIEAAIYSRLPVDGDHVSRLTFNLIQPGTSMEKNDMVWALMYSAEDIAIKGLESLLIPVQALTGNPDIIYEIDDERRNNIYFDHPRTRSFTIHLAEIEGYEFGETGNLDVSVENVSGKFRSSAILTSSGLDIKCKLELVNVFEPASNSALVGEIIRAYADFAEQKVLYRKTQEQ